MSCELVLRLCLHGSQVHCDITRWQHACACCSCKSAVTSRRSMGCGTSPASKATWGPSLSAMFVWSGMGTWQRASTSASPTCEASRCQCLLTLWQVVSGPCMSVRPGQHDLCSFSARCKGGANVAQSSLLLHTCSKCLQSSSDKQASFIF